MVFGWFDVKAATECGESLARRFSERVPVGANLDEGKFERQSRAALAELARQVAAFRKDKRLSTFQKAKLCNSFKWTLKDAGHNDAYVDKLTDWLLMQLQ